MTTVTVSQKFQVVVPLEMRLRLNIRLGTKLQVLEVNGSVRLMPLASPAALRGIARGIDNSLEDGPDRSL